MQQHEDHEENWLPIVDWGCAQFSLVDCDDRRLEEDDALPAHEHERVGRAEIDRQLATAGEPLERHDRSN